MKWNAWFGWSGIAALIVVTAPHCFAQTTPIVRLRLVPGLRKSINVSVYDDAGLGLKTVKQAEEVASYVFLRAGIVVGWRTCSVAGKLTHIESCAKAEYPNDLVVHFVRRPRNLKLDAAGVAYLNADGSGCYSDVFVEPVEELHREFSVSMANVLGQAAAHEIGHLLLGNNSHSPAGIMRAHWHRGDLVKADQGVLQFDDKQAGTMKRHLDLTSQARAEETLDGSLYR